MKKSTIFGFFAVGVLTIAGATVAINGKHSDLQRFAVADADPNTMTLDSSDTLASATSSYQNTFSSTVKTDLGNDVQLTFANAKNLDNGFIQLANHGKIHNFSDSDNHVYGINGIKFTGSGSLSFKPAFANKALYEVDPVSVAAGAAKVTVPTCDYFEIEAGDNGASITEITFYYSCSETDYDVKMLNGTFTGVGNDGYTYKATISNGSVTLASLDKASNISLNGTAEMTSKTRAKFTFSAINCTYVMDFDGHKFTYVSGKNAPVQIDLTRVYHVENFESYSATGTGYVSADAKYTTTGLRSQYYADYYTGSSSGEIGGSGWPIMTSTDNSTYNSAKGHNSSKVGIFKFSNGMSMRYISMNELYGVKRLIGKGTTLSFWARGAYTNANFNTNHASDTPMKFYAYYGTPLTSSNQTTVRESFDFTVAAGATWQHFEMPLTEGRNYYGFGFYAQQKSGSTQYVPIDDIEIYTASPYAEYVAPVSVTGVSVSPTALDLTTNGNSQLVATVAPNDATNKNVSWSSSNTNVATVASDGTVHAVAAGNCTITVTTADGGYTATCAVTVTAPATYYPEGTFKGTVIVNSANYSIVIAIGRQNSNLVSVKLANSDAGATGISYNTSTNQFTITTTGSYQGLASYGDITGTYDFTNNQLTGIACSGSVSSYVSNNGSITAVAASTSSTSAFFDCDGTTSQLQSTFKRRYMSGSWQVDNSNADRITSNTDQYVCGSGSVKRRGYSGGAVALNLNSDFASAKTVANIQFWVYNPSNSDIELRMWGYKATSFGSNFETGRVTAKAGQWTYVAMGFTSAAIYNFQIADFNNTGAYLSFDNIYLF